MSQDSHDLTFATTRIYETQSRAQQADLGHFRVGISHVPFDQVHWRTVSVAFEIHDRHHHS